MEKLFPVRKHSAGQALVTACEQALGAEGPAALARVTHRSKAWWCKLRAGKYGSLPNWAEMEEVIPADLDAEARDLLRRRHREAWLLFHDPELLALLWREAPPAAAILGSPAPPQPPTNSRRSGDGERTRQRLKG